MELRGFELLTRGGEESSLRRLFQHENMSSQPNEEGRMGTETPETILKTWMSRVWNELDDSAIDELLAPEALVHGLGDVPMRGRAEWRQFHSAYVTAFSDIRVDVEDQVVSADKVAGRIVVTMSHRATRTPVTITGMVMCRVSGGQIVEGWNAVDFVPMLTALNIVPQDAMARAVRV